MTKDNMSNYSFQELKAISLKEDIQLYASGLWEEWHELADAESQPAKEFLIERLQDLRSDWREVSISLLGFHYSLEQDILDQIRDLLVSDPDSGVRIAAAGVLGHQSKLPEKSLVQALIHDTKPLVRETAFSALLELADIPYMIRINELEKIDTGEIYPTLDQVKRILVECQKTNAVDMIKE
jgi:HEAT repeats